MKTTELPKNVDYKGGSELVNHVNLPVFILVFAFSV